ncbi:hypothetical protein C4K68_04555 [Pokkaliibacter plantistimulans]|uniref:Uncharacterized protein n=1 Tax=Proteobacteria bacterium 228 TaxID=2083153 RepID=A0A2S5KV59_9PROT|nr:hypothetical protein C4K68_04555 [Pokkaliibacter plantistimulans]
MNALDEQHAEAIKQALLAITPSGQNGFEGFLGIVLGAVTGQTFRLAKSGVASTKNMENLLGRRNTTALP